MDILYDFTQKVYAVKVAEHNKTKQLQTICVLYLVVLAK